MSHGGARQGAGRKTIAMEKSIKELVSPYLPDAVKTVCQIMMDESAKGADRVSAAKLLLAYGFGNPKSELDINNNIKGEIPVDKWLTS